jgi:hypothetical protein
MQLSDMACGPINIVELRSGISVWRAHDMCNV